MHTLSALALSVASAHALSPASNILKRQSDEASDKADEICQPKNSTGSPDFDAPCNVFIALQTQCMYGPVAADYVSLSEYDDAWDDAANWTAQPPETQRDCICQSQLFDQLSGCQKCYEHHDSNLFEYAPSFVGKDRGFADVVEEKYCAASMTPSIGWAQYIFEAANSMSASGSDSHTATRSAVTATETDVSRYFTASVPGSSAYLISQPSPTGSSGNVTYTSLNTESGMIKPTSISSAGNDNGEDGGEDSSTSAANSDAEQTGASSSDESAAIRISLANAAIAAGAMGFAVLLYGL
ncbi:hypothetical protein Q7P37_009628 [Cladosporium fusiforme]